MRRASTITILGQDGTGPAPDIHEIWEIVLPEAKAHFGADFDIKHITTQTPWGEQPHPQSKWCTDRVIERIHVYSDAAAHNELVAPINRMISLAERCRRARDEVDSLYDDLDKNTTINWLATHHRLVKATLRARELLTEHAALVTDLVGRDPAILGDERKHLPALYYNAHVPEEQRLQLPTKNDAATAQNTLEDFIELCTRRFEILRATITGAFPPGFAPTPVDVTAEWADENVPVSPALAYADHAMRIPGPRAGEAAVSVREW